jgi:hypothetical protein
MKIKICLLLSCLLIIYACSKDENNISSITPTYVTVSSQNDNMPTGGTLSIQYNDWTSGNDVSKIVDSDISTKLEVPHSNFWIIWKGTAKECINRCKIATTNDSPEMNPKSWLLSASNDSVNWDTLYIKKNFQFSKNYKGIKQTIDTIKNKVAYTYYKLTILGNNGASSTQIAEWSLDEVKISSNDDNIDDLMKYSCWSTYSSQTSMGTHYENCHVTTDADLIWLQTASNEPSIPSDLSGLQMKHFDVNLYPYGTPEPADVNQHSIGDCGACASLASMAYIHPDFVKSIIHKNTDGTFSVAMYDPQGVGVTVNVTSNFLTKSNGNIAAVSGKDNVATWSTVLEKAMMKYETIYNVDPGLEGIGGFYVTPLFTGEGNSFGFEAGTLSGGQLARVAKYALANGMFVVGKFTDVMKIGSLSTVTNHVYTVMLPSTTQSLFEMRNPWGYNTGGDGSDDGVLNIPLSGQVISTIYFHIIYSGKAGNTGVTKPYTTPSFAVSSNNVRVDERLIKTRK